MILLLLGCDTPALVYPVDTCRLGDDFADVAVSARCSGADGEITFADQFAGAGRVGGATGEGWEGLSFHLTGTTLDGETFSIGRRGDALGVYVRDGERSLVAGFLPASGDSYPSPYAVFTDGDRSCDTTGEGEVMVTGLPTTRGGSWTLSFSAGAGEATPLDAWDPAWPAGCALSPDAWRSVDTRVSCDGSVIASYYLDEPAAYEVELDPLSRTGDADATWPGVLTARCDAGDPDVTDVSLTTGDGQVRLYSPILTLVQDEGAWSVEATTCGTCDAWDVEVVGLPEL